MPIAGIAQAGQSSIFLHAPDIILAVDPLAVAGTSSGEWITGARLPHDHGVWALLSELDHIITVIARPIEIGRGIGVIGTHDPTVTIASAPTADANVTQAAIS